MSIRLPVALWPAGAEAAETSRHLRCGLPEIVKAVHAPAAVVAGCACPRGLPAGQPIRWATHCTAPVCTRSFQLMNTKSEAMMAKPTR